MRPTEGPPRVAFDLGWNDGDRYVVCEIKSLTQANEANQIRLGLGQVVDLPPHPSPRDAAPKEVIAALVLEQEPVNKRWIDVCAAVGVRLAWPETMAVELGL